MINLENMKVSPLWAHYVGNKAREEGVKLNNMSINLAENDLDREVLLTTLFSGYKDARLYNLYHETDIRFNEIYSHCTGAFGDIGLESEAKLIANYLYQNMNHPKLRECELFVMMLQDVMLDDEITNALGVFKVYQDVTFQRLLPETESAPAHLVTTYGLRVAESAIIFNTEKEQGYIVAMPATVVNDKQTNVHWIENFLQAKPCNDNFFKTRHAIDLCKNFVKEVFNEENEVERLDQAEFLHKASKYFKEKDEFNMQEFEHEVINAPEAINSFREYKKVYEEDFDVDIPDTFELSEQAAKKAKTVFKSVIKLDTNFHIYVHGDRELMTKGFDEARNRNFYQFWFEEEK